MAKSTGYPKCPEDSGVQHFAWHSEATCVMSCGKKDNALCVEPDVTDIGAWSLVTLNANGIAVQVTADNWATLVRDRSEVYFTVDAVKPKEAGKQRWFWSKVKIAQHCINWEVMLADTTAKKDELIRLAKRKDIDFVYVHVN